MMVRGTDYYKEGFLSTQLFSTNYKRDNICSCTQGNRVQPGF